MTTLAILCGGCGGTDASPPVAAATGQHPGKVTVAGDSVALGLGIAMRGAADSGAGDEPVIVRAIGEDGTGLARPDNFDWPGRLAELARDFAPGALVFSVGSNDAQDLTDSRGRTVATMADDEAWDEEYSRRLAAAFDKFEGTGTTVVWVGHVRPEDERVADMNRHIHELAVAVAADRDWVQVQDLAELTGSGADGTSECLSADGLHLNSTCYDQAAVRLLERLDPG